jgi:RimJ/RimL family protein N-acetyltransferase
VRPLPSLHRGVAAGHRARQEALRRHRAVLIETDRLLLRRFSPEDLDHFVALHSEPEVTRFIRPLGREEAAERLHRDEVEWAERGHGILAVFEKAGGEFVGRAGLKYWPQFDETELGWALRREAWGQGYATEAARACRDWGLAELDVPYLTAMIVPVNARSIAVAERLGMSAIREDELLGEAVVVYAVEREPAPFRRV